MTENHGTNRRRKWAPKARTGCRTCKTRHVKCDEQRPMCRRCLMSGFRCDGYPSIPSKREMDEDSHSEDSPENLRSESQTLLFLSPTATEGDRSPTESSSALTILTVSPSQPCIGHEARSFKYFTDVTAAMVSRSRSGPRFWQTLVPQAAQNYPSIRHAMLATAITCESLVNRDRGTLQRKQSGVRVMSHTSKALQALLAPNVPLDVVLLTSATLGIMDLFNGQWDTACMHVTSGAALAKQARSQHSSDRYISFYCDAFASALPSVLKRAQNPESTCPPEKNAVVRLQEAVRSLHLAMHSFDQTIVKVDYHQRLHSARILAILDKAKIETEWISSRWEALLREELQRISPPDEDSMVNLHRIESPFSAIMTGLDQYLETGSNDFDIDKFEVAAERTLPFYMLAKSGPNIRMREDAAELMFLSSQLRSKLPLTTSTQPSPQPLTILSRENGG